MLRPTIIFSIRDHFKTCNQTIVSSSDPHCCAYTYSTTTITNVSQSIHQINKPLNNDFNKEKWPHNLYYRSKIEDFNYIYNSQSSKWTMVEFNWRFEPCLRFSFPNKWRFLWEYKEISIPKEFIKITKLQTWSTWALCI